MSSRGCQPGISREPILVVDDSPTVVRLLRMALETGGYSVETASTGEEGLSRARELCPPVMLVDAMMPGLDGYELCASIRSDRTLVRQPHVIMLTASGQEADRVRAEHAGVDEFMTKPFSPSNLLDRVAGVLRERDLTDERSD